MIDEPKRLDLKELGTRWEHYSELRELFAIGIEILKHLTVRSPSDRDKQRKLESAVEMIDGRINLLADYTFQTTYGSKLRAVVDGDVDNIYRKLKRENEDAAKANKPSGENNASPSAYPST